MIPWESMFTFEVDLTNPRSFVATYGGYGALLSLVFCLIGVANWGIQAICVYFAYLDHKRLLAMGVPKPFHWVWAVLGSVYPLGRSIVAVRRTGHGWPPFWATVGVLLLSVVVSVVITIEMMRAAFEMVLEIAAQLPA